MADSPIIPHDYHFAKGAKAFHDHKGPESHGLNWHSAALTQWKKGYATAAIAANHARLAKRYVDIAQVSA